MYVASQAAYFYFRHFNEWIEGTQIEPSVTYGDLYLNLTRDLANAFRSGQVFVPTATPTPTSTPTPTLTPSNTPTPTETHTPTLTYTPTPTSIPTDTPTTSPSPTATFAPTFTSQVITQITPAPQPARSLPNVAPSRVASTSTGVPIWIGPMLLALAAVLTGFVIAGRLGRR